MKPASQSSFQIIGWIILIAMLGLSFFLLPVVMTMMHDRFPREGLALWFPSYALVVTFPVMAAHFYWLVLRKRMIGLSFWFVVAAATLGLVLLHRWNFEERISSNHREVVTFFIGSFMAGTLGAMFVFGLIGRFVPRWMAIAQTPPSQLSETDRQRHQISLKSIFIWTSGIAVIAAAFTNQDKFILLENEGFRIFIYQLSAAIGYAVFCVFVFLPVQAWLSNVAPRWLGKLSLLFGCALLPVAVFWIMSIVTNGAFQFEEMAVTLTLSSILFYLSVYAILWNLGCRWTGLITGTPRALEPARKSGFFRSTFSLLRSGAKYLILACTVAFILLSIVWGAIHLTGGEAQDVERVAEKIHKLSDSDDVDRDWLEAVNDQLSQGITAENNVAVKLIKICNPYPVTKTNKVDQPDAQYALAGADADPSRLEEVERLGLTLEQLADLPPLAALDWMEARQDDFRKQLEKDFPAVAEQLRLKLQQYNARYDVPDFFESNESVYDESVYDESSPDESRGEPQDAPVLTPEEKLAEIFLANGVELGYLSMAPWNASHCSLGADFVESHRSKTEQLIELSKETTLYTPIVRERIGTITPHQVCERLLGEPSALLLTTAYFDLGSGDTESAVVICEALWRFANLSRPGTHHVRHLVLKRAKELSKAIVFSGSATESQMRRLLKSRLEIAQTEDSLARTQGIDRILQLGRVYDRMTAPTDPSPSLSAMDTPFLLLYQKYPNLINWEVFLDRTEELADQTEENDRLMLAGELTQKQYDDRNYLLLGKTFSNGWVVPLNRYNLFPSQKFSVFVHGPKSKGKMIAESAASRAGESQWIPFSLSLKRIRTYELGNIAIALEIYKSKNSVYPANLQDLVPEILPAIPKDPVTLADFVYTPTKSEFKLYSTGRDGVDDGGDEEKDVVFKRPLKDIFEHLIGDQ